MLTSDMCWTCVHCTMDVLQTYNLDSSYIISSAVSTGHLMTMDLQEEEQLVIVAAALFLLLDTPRRWRRWWVRPWIRQRFMEGTYDYLMEERWRDDGGESDFKGYLWLEPAIFDEVLARVWPHVEKAPTWYRDPLLPGLKLPVTICCLATGNSFRSLAYESRVLHNTILMFIPEVCQAIINEYSFDGFHCPQNPKAWERVTDRFAGRWNFHHVYGAIDGKHIAKEIQWFWEPVLQYYKVWLATHKMLFLHNQMCIIHMHEFLSICRASFPSCCWL